MNIDYETVASQINTLERTIPLSRDELCAVVEDLVTSLKIARPEMKFSEIEFRKFILRVALNLEMPFVLDFRAQPSSPLVRDFRAVYDHFTLMAGII